MSEQESVDQTPSEAASQRSQVIRRDAGFHVVGLGASAGGLEALQTFFSVLPENTGMAFVIVQHLSPDFKSLMVELLTRHTKMPVLRVEDQMVVEPNTVYLIPRNREMLISGGRLLLRERIGDGSLSLPIDRFFSSLAQDAGPMGIGIVLSGTGSDGSRGLMDIHSSGGLVIAQRPESAKFDGMPRTAIETGMVDAVATPEEIPELLGRYALHPFPSELSTNSVDPESVERVFELLQQRQGIDFSDYKPATIGRRIERRIKLNNDVSLKEYISRLENDEEELTQLYKDLLIGVTKFFRDTDAFATLRESVLRSMLADHDRDTEFRVWVPGCATGEEAYSLAISIRETLHELQKPLSIRVFATDVHRQSLEYAHIGEYPAAALEGTDPEWVERYFVETQNGGYRIASTIRDCVVFAPHNVVCDTPFTHLDLISCRNLLIYLRNLAQKKVISLFHYGLRKGGCLFLGSSETIGELSEEFDAVSDRWKLFRKKRDVRLFPTNHTGFATVAATRRNPASRPAREQPSSVSEPSLAKQYERLLQRFMPSALLVDERRTIVHVFGGAGRYLSYRDGRVSSNLLELVDGDLRAALSGGLQRIDDSPLPIQYPAVELPGEGPQAYVDVEISRIDVRQPGATYLITFTEPSQKTQETQETQGTQQDGNQTPVRRIRPDRAALDHIEDLETELRYTKEDLQATIEELETSNEELQATNEELIASNEELQSTNEELQSVNEELFTVNSEYQTKINELTTLTNDMDHLLASTEVHTLFLDTKMEIRRFTPKMADVFHLLRQDIGRPIEAFSHSILCDHLVSKIRSVLDSGEPHEERVQDKRGQHFLLRVLPYRVKEGITGTVLTLIDIGSLIEAQAVILRERERFERAIAANRDGIWDWPNLQADEMWWSPRCWELLGYSEHELEPKHSVWLSLIHPEDRKRVERTSVPAQDDCYVEVHRDFEYRMLHRSGEYRWFRHRAVVDRDENDRPIRMTGSVGDIHDRKSAELQNVEATQAIERRDRFLAMLSHELRNPMSAVLNSIELLEEVRELPFDAPPVSGVADSASQTDSASDAQSGGDEDQTGPDNSEKRSADAARATQAMEIVKRQTRHMARLLDDLLDVSRFGQQKIEFRREWVDLVALHGDVIRAVQHHFEDKSQTLHLDVPDEVIVIDADPARIKQAQVNLLTNASKYTPPGGDIWYSIRRHEGKVAVTIRDNGEGIAEDLQQHIFDLFVQSESSLARSSGGMGVGLSLARQIVEAHQGTLVVHSDGPGTGSTFTIELPCSETQAISNTETIDRSKPVFQGAGVRVLIVEDNRDAGEMLAQTLRLKGYDVRLERDGEVALIAFPEFRPDVAVIDIGLPTMDGYQLAREIRGRGENRVTLIALTGYGRVADQRQAIEAGFDAHFVKPFDPKSFFQTLSEIKPAREQGSGPQSP
jgi:two-component system CheB/CheR fusion protein